jgi:hypothetical protein
MFPTGECTVLLSPFSSGQWRLEELYSSLNRILDSEKFFAFQMKQEESVSDGMMK